MSLIIRQSYPAQAAAPPPPALAFDAQSQGGTTGAASLTVAHTVVTTSGYGLLLVTVSILDAALTDPHISGVTFNGAALTFLPGSQVIDSGAHYQETWYLKNPAAGTHNIVVSTTATANINLAADSWDGVNQSAPLGTPTTNSGPSGTSATAAISGVASGDVTRGSLTIFGGTATTAATAQGNNVGLASVIGGASPVRLRLQTSSNVVDTGAVTASWTLAASKPWTACAVEIKKA